ncbi:hypothetical protein [Nocardioides sp. YIM 152588]|uniref:hypothetical protein n=1 Tax=Nocardioides sp. YIM 152588 TaxID=3158259 RepID=UPI0032E4BE84
MADVSPPGLPALADYPAFLRRHARWIAVGMLVGLALGWLWSLRSPEHYSARASVALTPVPVYVTTPTTETIPPEVSIDTDAHLLNSPKVLRAIADALGVDEAEAADALSVTASANSHVLHIRIAGSSPQRAADAANAAAKALIQRRRTALAALRPGQQRQLRTLVAYETRVLSREQDGELVTTESAELADQVFLLETALRQLEEARANPGEVVSPAIPPSAADRPDTEVPLVSGAMLGLLCGCAIGAARDRLARSGRRRMRELPRPAHIPTAEASSLPRTSLRTHDAH